MSSVAAIADGSAVDEVLVVDQPALEERRGELVNLALELRDGFSPGHR
ncbi:hypothetical protein [Pimelobacter simplex]|nr:hypothetical protein [Pimelobacter simplex]UUW92563.1 hypothetical protein M0M43_14075 [Pimelobacter simplex]UUW96390.1 hypothetical protein M0M48_02705 [Pimelobacter simplex]